MSMKFLFCYLLVDLLFVHGCLQKPDTRTIICKIPYLSSCPDGQKNQKWHDHLDPLQIYVSNKGNNPEESDLSAFFKTAWCSERVVIYCQVKDDTIIADPNNPWKSDAIEIFLAPARGSTDITQLTIIPGKEPTDSKSTVIIGDYRTTPSIRKIPVRIDRYTYRLLTFIALFRSSFKLLKIFYCGFIFRINGNGFFQVL